jgi:hypothetical protein
LLLKNSRYTLKGEYFPDNVEAVAQRRFVTAVSQGYKPCESKESREVGNALRGCFRGLLQHPLSNYGGKYHKKIFSS